MNFTTISFMRERVRHKGKNGVEWEERERDRSDRKMELKERRESGRGRKKIARCEMREK
jgi:hypothetical protein